MPKTYEETLQEFMDLGGLPEYTPPEEAPRMRAALGGEELTQRAWQEGRVPGMDPKVWQAQWREGMQEPLGEWWEKPRYQKFMDVLDVITSFAEPQKAVGTQGAAFLFTPKALEKATKEGMRTFAQNMRRGSPMYDAMRKAYKEDIIIGRGVTAGAKKYTKETGRQLYGQAFESQLRRPGGKPISQVAVTEASPEPSKTLLHEWGHRGFEHLPTSSKRKLTKLTQSEKGAHPRALKRAASSRTIAEESLMYTMQDLITTGTTSAPASLAEEVMRLMGWR